MAAASVLYVVPMSTASAVPSKVAASTKMAKCCPCTSNGTHAHCKSCICVKSNWPCSSCQPIKRSCCFNTKKSVTIQAASSPEVFSQPQPVYSLLPSQSPQSDSCASMPQPTNATPQSPTCTSSQLQPTASSTASSQIPVTPPYILNTTTIRSPALSRVARHSLHHPCGAFTWMVTSEVHSVVQSLTHGLSIKTYTSATTALALLPSPTSPHISRSV